MINICEASNATLNSLGPGELNGIRIILSWNCGQNKQVNGKYYPLIKSESWVGSDECYLSTEIVIETGPN